MDERSVETSRAGAWRGVVRKYGYVLAGLLGLLLAGCVGGLEDGSAVVESLAQPAAGESADGIVVDAWVGRFGDPVLNDLVAEAMVANAGLAAAVARLEQSVELARVQGADRLPQLNLSASAQRQMVNNGVEPVVRQRAERFGANAVLSWELDIWGRVRARGLAASLDAEAAVRELDAVRLSLASRVAQAWFGLVERRLQTQLADETLATFTASQDVIEERFRRGLSPALDVRLIRATVANAEATVQRQRRLEATALRQLEVLLGRYPSGALASNGSLPQLEEPLPEGLPAALLERRPDLLALRDRIRAADARVVESERSLLPAISLTASYGRSSAELDNLLKDSFDVWNLLGGLTMPIFQGGRIRATTRRLEARLSELVAQFRETALEALAEVETGLVAEAHLRQQLGSLERAAEEFAGAEQLAQERYERGLVDIITVLDAQRSAFNARSAAITAQNELLQNRLTLYRALGGDPL